MNQRNMSIIIALLCFYEHKRHDDVDDIIIKLWRFCSLYTYTFYDLFDMHIVNDFIIRTCFVCNNSITSTSAEHFRMLLKLNGKFFFHLLNFQLYFSHSSDSYTNYRKCTTKMVSKSFEQPCSVFEKTNYNC